MDDCAFMICILPMRAHATCAGPTLHNSFRHFMQIQVAYIALRLGSS